MKSCFVRNEISLHVNIYNELVDVIVDCVVCVLCGAGEEGKMAHRHVEMSQDSIPSIFAPGSMASTAF